MLPQNCDTLTCIISHTFPIAINDDGPSGPHDNSMVTHSTGTLAPSPRIQHFDGEIPPSLSPLDAFAAQGRQLAKELSESKKGDRRLSRLPPSSVVRSLSQPRPGYFRTLSTEGSNRKSINPDLSNQGGFLQVEEPTFSPQSQHPR